mmetsp:Transcript_1090/g.1767  ORF Transcript_1090/g.1767 Transcript_1090/m.1767 type:complete len:520 (+) Transcript_1090:176-1735(+)|eukprot:CAMPEP_0203750962 /NCGR_PEP_ID=MMETSP0098-20131031/5117_1 /ASSEMBLY_ACC=CAM_ASM_000208 /TAXON_ID=96639 /ORGANISM=" , Strain NY0313808BC1" /LENGTH=519 /DNA_ID=CAMNT_0050640477 /DNA_START=112 /DNA_END=1671 /DNA_ORIENTATION=-
MSTSALKHEAGMAMAASPDTDAGRVESLQREYEVVLGQLKERFDSGVTTTLEWRLGQVKAIRRMVVENQERIAEALHKDLGKHAFESFLSESAGIVGECDHCAENLESWMQPQKVSHPLTVQPGSSYIEYKPKGVVLILSPWNYPVFLGLTKLTCAIVAGNCCVLKPSEVAPASAELLEELINKYLDTDSVKVIQGAVPETTALLNLRWDHIFYTGNGAVGRIVASAAAKNLTPITLELGGKSPVFVDKNCNLKVVAKRLVSGKLMNCGQTCIAPDYVLVDKKIQNEFLQEVESVIETFYGKDQKSSASLGRIINHRHWSRIMSMIDETTHNGKVVFGGKEHADRSENYIPPTIIVDPSPESPVMQEEIFGPVMPVIPVDNMDEAIRFVNSREHPLALYIFANDQSVIDKILNNTQSGGVTVNDTVMHIANPHLPFGGAGTSGVGSYHGIHGFQEMSNQRAIMYRSTWLDPNMRYPPYKASRAQSMEKMLFAEPMSPATKRLLLVLGITAAGATVLSRL